MPDASATRSPRVIVCVTSVGDPSVLGAGANVNPAQPFGPAAGEPILNPADQAALQLARALTRADAFAILAVHVGVPGDEPCLRDALAHGAGAGLLLEAPDARAVDALFAAQAIAELCAALRPDWIVCGQATLDWGNALVGPLLAGRLGWPVVDHVLEIRAEGDGVARCQRCVGRGARDELTVAAPAVIAASPLAFQPAIPPLRDRVRAQRATIETRPGGNGAALPRAARSSLARPRPRPKASLPAEYSEWSAEERLSYFTQAVPVAKTEATRWLRGDVPAMASEILDYLESAGVHMPWAR